MLPRSQRAWGTLHKLLVACGGHPAVSHASVRAARLSEWEAPDPAGGGGLWLAAARSSEDDLSASPRVLVGTRHAVRSVSGKPVQLLAFGELLMR